MPKRILHPEAAALRIPLTHPSASLRILVWHASRVLVKATEESPINPYKWPPPKRSQTTANFSGAIGNSEHSSG